MLHNPYPSQVDNVDRDALRFQTYLNGEDKALLVSIRPIKGTAQVVINHLIKNLCNELRELNITGYHPDADDILSILVEPRDLTDGQLARLGCTTAGLDKQVSTRLFEHRGRAEVRKGTTNPSTSSHNPTKSTTKRVKPARRKTSTAKTRSKETTAHGG